MTYDHELQKRIARREEIIAARDRLVPLLRATPGGRLRTVEAARRLGITSNLVMSIAELFPRYVTSHLIPNGCIGSVSLHPHLAVEAPCTTAAPAATRRTPRRPSRRASIPTTASASSPTTPISA